MIMVLVNYCSIGKTGKAVLCGNGYRLLKDVSLASMVLIPLCRLLELKAHRPVFALCPLRPGLGLGTCWAITPAL
jgi:hypothetical protein